LANTAIESSDDALRHAAMLHRLGTVVYLDGLPNLSFYLLSLILIISHKGTNMVVLDPNWLLDVFRALVSVRHRLIGSDGVLQRTDLRRIWSDVPVRVSSSKFVELFSFL
jgi:hypothetical protein